MRFLRCRLDADTSAGAVLLMLWLAIAFQFVVVVRAQGDEGGEAKAKGALALAKAKRERDNSKAQTLACHTDYATAAKEAEKTGKPLVVWVGVQCVEHPGLRKALDSAVHCHATEWHKNKEARIVIQGSDGNEYYVTPEKIKADTADKLKAKWELPYVPPVRGDARISEEVFYRPAPPAYYAPVRFAAMPSYRSFGGDCPTAGG